jgi:hypothetical protein
MIILRFLSLRNRICSQDKGQKAEDKSVVFYKQRSISGTISVHLKYNF